MGVISDLKRHEGFRATPYRCPAGKLTIGYGINLDAGITEDEAELLLKSRIEKIRAQMDIRFTWWRDLDWERQSVLVNMAYNLGFDGLLKFKKMLNRIANKDYDGAAREMLESKWAIQVKERSNELAHIMMGGSAI